MRDAIRQSVLFGSFFRKRVEVAFDAAVESSGGGVLLLSALDRKLGLSAALAAALSDTRQSGKTEHSTLELLRQGLYSRALGYADGNDARHLAPDPAFKIALGRRPASDADLASQPTLSCFENAPSAGELVAMGHTLERFVVERLRQKHRHARVIWIDLDATHDPTYGLQQQTFFHGDYDCHCYLPLSARLPLGGR